MVGEYDPVAMNVTLVLAILMVIAVIVGVAFLYSRYLNQQQLVKNKRDNERSSDG